MAKYEAKSVLDAKAELGEHPLWSAAEQCLYWVDIESLNINRFDPATGKNETWKLPSKPGCFMFRAAGGIMLAAQDGFYDFDPASGDLKKCFAPAHDPETMRFNDGRTDRQGRFWAGTVNVNMADLANNAANAYYKFDGKKLEKMLTDVGLTNGTAFSPDGRTMYRAQTEIGKVFAYDYDTETGAPRNQRDFAAIPTEYGVPDGATVDTEGGYWVALSKLPGTGQHGGVMRFTADGRQDQYIQFPVPFVTMPAFGGPDLSTLYVTTGALSALIPGAVLPHAGSLFAVETGFTGAPEVPFRAI